MSKPFFHRMTDQRFNAMRDNGATWGDIQRIYQQPEWCNYPDALAGAMGCWSLIGRIIHRKQNCAGCECKGRSK